MIYYLTWWNVKISNVVARWTNQCEDIARGGVSYNSKKFRIILPRWSIETTELPPDASGLIVEGISSKRRIKEYRGVSTEKIDGKLHLIETTDWTFPEQDSPKRVLTKCCPFVYRGSLCGYDGPGYTVDGEDTTKEGENDICPRTVDACNLRFGNRLPFGGISF